MERERESWQLSNWQLTRAVRRRLAHSLASTVFHMPYVAFLLPERFIYSCLSRVVEQQQTTTTTKHPYVALRYRQLPGELALAHFRCVINCDCHFAAFWEDFSAAAWSAEGWTPCTVPYPSLPLSLALHYTLYSTVTFISFDYQLTLPFLCLLLALLLMQLHLTLVYLLGEGAGESVAGVLPVTWN